MLMIYNSPTCNLQPSFLNILTYFVTMKIFYFSVILFFCISFAKAQVNPLDTLGYRMSVVSNVKDVALVTGMSAAKQITLANFFQKAEDTINGAVNSELPARLWRPRRTN